MRRQSAAEAKRDFSQVLRAAEQGEETVVLRNGRPVAVVVPYSSDEPRRSLPRPIRPGGLLSLVGSFADWETMDADLDGIVAARQQAVDRPPVDFTR